MKMSRSRLWEKFDKEIKKPSQATSILEQNCIPRDNTICINCNIHMRWSDEGFMTCPNQTCGFMCMDIVESESFSQRCLRTNDALKLPILVLFSTFF